VVSLGPSCYISFNFDHLLELALAKWLDGVSFRIVGNMQPIDVADIVHARATHFVFKPHGDVDSTESIILSREQYRELASPRGFILHSLEMLFATRPILLLGFGLRDPDFFRVKDVLAAIYKGGAGEHYAVMPDMAAQEIAYWQRQYGIHVLTYPTSSTPDGLRDHSALLSILDDFIASTPSTTASHVALELFDLARHGARLAQESPPAPSRLLPLVVSRRSASRGGSIERDEVRYDGAPVNDLLKSYPGHLILCGPPGAGKTFAVRNFAATLGADLREACLFGTDEVASSPIPMYADLKFYDGDIEGLLDATLPHDLSLAAIRESRRAIFILDAANEMSSEHIESGHWLGDLMAFIAAAENNRVVITTREADWMRDLSVASFHISDVDQRFVRRELTAVGLDSSRLSNPELMRVLSKPLIFSLVSARAIAPEDLISPKHIYLSFFRTAQKRVGMPYDDEDLLSRALSSLAIDPLGRGLEFFGRGDAESHLARHIPAAVLGDRSADDILNALVVENVLVATSAARLTFVISRLRSSWPGLSWHCAFSDLRKC
jgi:hypothetical protein